MTKKRVIWIATMSLGLFAGNSGDRVGLLWGQGTVPPIQATTQVTELISQLDSNSLSKRESAELALENLDEKVWNAIPEDLQLSAETRSRLERIRQKVEQRFAASGAEASLVTLSNPASVTVAINAISAQTGNSIFVPPQSDQAVELSVENVPFWKAMDTFLDLANLDITEHSNNQEQGLSLVPRIPDRPLRASTADYAGIFRIEPASINVRAFAVNPKMNSLQVSLNVAWEPRVQPIRIAMPMEAVSVQLDNGETITPVNPEHTPEASGNAGVYSTELSIVLPGVPREAKSITKLTGKLKATLPGRKATLRIPLTREQPLQRGAITLTMEEVRPAGILDEVRFLVKLDNPADSLQSHYSWIFENEAYIVDREGKRMERLGLEVYRQANNEVGIALLFELGDRKEGAVLVYETPLAIVAAEWPFTLRNILLP